MLDPDPDLMQNPVSTPSKGVLRWAVAAPVLLVWNVVLVLDYVVVPPMKELGYVSAGMCALVLLACLGFYLFDGLRALICTDVARYKEIRRLIEVFALINMSILLISLLLIA